MLRLIHSNRLESLFDTLIELIQNPLQAVLAPEYVICQSKGMGHWLSMRIAEKLTVSANIEYLFPASMIWKLYQQQFSELPDKSIYDRDILVWKIMKLLPVCKEEAGFTDLAHYLNSADDLKYYQLAQHIADVFDQYMVFRPQWICRWEQGEDSHWQALLWQKICADKSTLHRADLLTHFLDLNAQGQLKTEALPERIILFAISAIPPATLDIFHQIAAVTDVYCFVLNPCLQYWGDILSQKDITKIKTLRKVHCHSKSMTYYTIGNSLLASMGKLGRDFHEQLQNYTPDFETTCFQDPGSDHLLTAIQSDILYLIDRQNIVEDAHAQNNDLFEPEDTPRATITPQDHSIQIHACHSPIRELEVLHDQLLALFEADHDLKPRDIIVMAPDIDLYAPYINAVFGSVSDKHTIPWSITDCTIETESTLFQAFLQLLELPKMRFTASEMIALLETPAIASQFELDTQTLQNIKHWINSSGIRWGDSIHSFNHSELPSIHRNNWEYGLKRMLLGYAMPSHHESLFEDVLPYQGIEGQQSNDLGRLFSFIDHLKTFKAHLSQPHDVQHWLVIINQLLDTFFAVDSELFICQKIRDTLSDLAKNIHLSGYQSRFSIQVIKHFLQSTISGLDSGNRFLTGQVTFCSMVPMRNIPAKVICIIGANDTAFPRSQPSQGFDLMTKKPQLGDRIRRDDDRYLFLEALLSARACFYISYIGRNIQDNSQMLPSCLVIELLDYITGGFNLTDKSGIQSAIVTNHCLQPFNQAYFNKNPLFTYNKQWLDAVIAHYQKPKSTQNIISAPLEISPEYQELDLDSLIHFFMDPARFLLKKQLSIYLEEAVQIPKDTEPFNLDHLETYQFNQILLNKTLSGESLDDYYDVLSASGQLAYGHIGSLFFERQKNKIHEFIKRFPDHQPIDPVEIDIEIDQFKIKGWLTHITNKGLISYRFTRLKPEDLIRQWIYHLALNISRKNNVNNQSLHLAENQSYSQPPVTTAEHYLSQLLTIYWQGLSIPVHFFPKSGYEYIKQLIQGKSSDDALQSAASAFQAFEQRGDFASPYCQKLYKNRPIENILDSQFEQCAEMVFQPILNLGKAIK